jgi:hypothetical protein
MIARDLALSSDQLRIDRPQLRMLAHYDHIASEGPHGGCRHCRDRHENADVIEVAAQVANDTRCGLGTTPGAVQDEIQARTVEVSAHLHHPLHILENDG